MAINTITICNAITITITYNCHKIACSISNGLWNYKRRLRDGYIDRGALRHFVYPILVTNGFKLYLAAWLVGWLTVWHGMAWHRFTILATSGANATYIYQYQSTLCSHVGNWSSSSKANGLRVSELGSCSFVHSFVYTIILHIYICCSLARCCSINIVW